MRILTLLGVATSFLLAAVYVNCWFITTVKNNNGYKRGTVEECFMETLETYKGAIYGSR